MLKRTLLLLLLAISLIIGTVQIALADSLDLTPERGRPDPQPIPMVVAGEVKELLADGFMLATGGREFQIRVDGETEYRIPGDENPGLGDIVQGDQAAVTGILDPTATPGTMPSVILAKLVVIRRPDPQPIRVAGTVANKGDAGFDLQAENGRVYSVIVNNLTRFQIPGIENPTYAHVQDGDQAIVSGIWQADPTAATANQILAQLVVIRRPVMRLEGRVTGLLSETRGFELTTAEDDIWQVRVDDDTEFEIPGVPGGGLGDLRLGDQAIVLGQVPVATTAATRTIDAAKVVIRRPVFQVAGIVTAVWPEADPQYFALQTTEREDWIILVDDETQYRIPGDPDPQFSDIEVDDYAVVMAPQPVNDTREVTADVVALRKAVFRLAGEITAMFDDENGQGFTLLARNTLADNQGTEWTVLVDESTEYRIPGTESPGFEDLQVGDKAQVTSEPPEAGSHTVTAETVAVCCRVFEVAGEVVLIDEANSSFRLQPNGGGQPWTILVDPDTEFKIPGDDTPEFSDMRVGDRAVAITDEPPAATVLSFTADLVIVHHPRPIQVTGVVEAVNPDPADPSIGSFDLNIPGDGTKTVMTDENTDWIITGMRNPSLQDLEVGARAMVWAWENEETGDLLATKVLAHNPRPRPVNLLGEITAIDATATSFELTLRSGEIRMIGTNEGTRYLIPGMPGATFADLAVGAMALVNALESPDGTLTALNVVVQRSRPRLGRVAGRIESITDNGDGTYDLRLTGQDVIVRVDGGTLYRIPRDSDPGLDDLKVDDYIMANGEWVEDNVLLAKAVGLVPVRLSAEEGL